MGLYTRGQPAQRLYLDGRASRAYMGERLVWSDVALGVIGAVATTAVAAMAAPLVTPGFGAAMATASAVAPAPTVSAHVTVTVPRATATAAAPSPDRPIVAAAVAATATAVMYPPLYIDAEVISPPAAAAAAFMPPPVVGVAVAAQPMTATAEGHAPIVAGTAVVELPVATATADAPTPVYVIAVTPAAMAASAAVGAPVVTATARVDASVMSATAAVPSPAIGAVAAQAMIATAQAHSPTATGSSTVSAVAAAASSLAPTPVLAATSSVAAVGGAASAAAPVPAIVTGITVTDDFNRADGGLGANYTTIGANAPVIATNRAQAGVPGYNAGNVVYLARHNTALTSDTQEISWNIIAPTANTTPSLGGGCFLRSTTGGDMVLVSVTDTQVHINTRIGGTFANRATGSVSSPKSARLTAVGNVYSVYINGAGTPAVTWTDSGGVIGIGGSNRSFGIYASAANSFGTVTRGWGIDAFTARDI
ncbi:hypothetical protein GV791_14990 [Nocardia cyriacigeorgica]|uniref:Uncharacterized protein n=1 Tax=Nocardia cyriacigeorgica TaxID=135487 RepID=A0A6P1CMQ5_9NOCA|nr:hypothetical protein [Nocardia cyriacigeorgica]NEW33859.1 hypothetical protein [Nocardia cyriacigeorgica]